MKRYKHAESARYLKLVEWSEEDQCFVGSCPALIGPACHGDDEAKVYADLCDIVDEWVEILKSDGKRLPEETAGRSYSGRFNLRVSSGLHQALALRAASAGESLNRYVERQLERTVSPG